MLQTQLGPFFMRWIRRSKIRPGHSLHVAIAETLVAVICKTCANRGGSGKTSSFLLDFSQNKIGWVPGASHASRCVLCAAVSQFKCCGSNSSLDWSDSIWILTPGHDRMVPDSCCKTPRELCGRRDHPSNIYKLEVCFPCSVQTIITGLLKWVIFGKPHGVPQGGCIGRLEEFILSQLHILGGVGIGIAFLQVKTSQIITNGCHRLHLCEVWSTNVVRV